MFEQLFGSKTRVKLLRLFYGNPARSFYVREITRKVDEQINSVRRELANMVSAGVIKSKGQNNRLYYHINKDFVFFNDFKNIFQNSQADVNEEDKFTKKIRQVGHIYLAVLSGFFTGDSRSPVDLFLVGEVNRSNMNELLEELERDNNREINFSVMTLDEYKYRSMLYDRFLNDIMEGQKMVLIDELPEAKKDLAETRDLAETPQQEIIAEVPVEAEPTLT